MLNDQIFLKKILEDDTKNHMSQPIKFVTWFMILR